VEPCIISSRPCILSSGGRPGDRVLGLRRVGRGGGGAGRPRLQDAVQHELRGGRGASHELPDGLHDAVRHRQPPEGDVRVCTQHWWRCGELVGVTRQTILITRKLAFQKRCRTFEGGIYE